MPAGPHGSEDEPLGGRVHEDDRLPEYVVAFEGRSFASSRSSNSRSSKESHHAVHVSSESNLNSTVRLATRSPSRILPSSSKVAIFRHRAHGREEAFLCWR